MNRQVDKEASLGSWCRARPTTNGAIRAAATGARPTAAVAIRTTPRRAGVGPHGDAHHSTVILTAVATLVAAGE
jgi:hypothetical protein